MGVGPEWRAGFELELVLGTLDEERWERELGDYGPMDTASPQFCEAVARRLKMETGYGWIAPRKPPRKPGFYVVSEYDLDPILWPDGLLAGVELLTPPLPLNEAETVRVAVAQAVEEIDGCYNFIPSDVTADCAWHINIDAGGDQRLDPANFILGVNELRILQANDRLFSKYTGLQRHPTGIAVLRHLRGEREGRLLRATGLTNLLNATAGTGKRYAANFAKLERGYVELRHFSALSFLNGPSLQEHLEIIPTAFEAPTRQLEAIFLRKFSTLLEWLEELRPRLDWKVGDFGAVSVAEGDVWLDGEPIGSLLVNGTTELHLHGKKRHEPIASMWAVTLPDIAEAVALLALDLAELRNMGLPQGSSPCREFQRAVLRLAKRLRADPGLASAHQLEIVRTAEQVQQAEADQFREILGGRSGQNLQ